MVTGTTGSTERGAATGVDLSFFTVFHFLATKVSDSVRAQ